MIFKVHENDRDYYFASAEEMTKHYEGREIKAIQVNSVITLTSPHFTNNIILAMTEEEVLKDLKELTDTNEVLKLYKYYD